MQVLVVRQQVELQVLQDLLVHQVHRHLQVHLLQVVVLQQVVPLEVLVYQLLQDQAHRLVLQLHQEQLVLQDQQVQVVYQLVQVVQQLQDQVRLQVQTVHQD